MSVLVAILLLAGLMPQSVVAATSSPSGPGDSGAAPTTTTPFPFVWRGSTKSPPSENSISAGGYVSVSFSLGGDRGLNIFPARTPRWHRYACSDGETFPYDEHATSPRDGTGLRYDKASDTYTYTWRVWQQWANTCRLFQLSLSDGTVHVAKFRIAAFDWIAPTKDWWDTNDVLAGSTLQLGFVARVGSTTDVLGPGKPTSQQMDCQTNALIPNTRRREATATFSVLNAPLRQFALTWPTQRAWVGTCRQLQMTLADGSLEIAKFRFHDYRPLITTSAGSTRYRENAAPVSVDPALRLRDDGATILLGATARITTGRQPGDRLAFTAHGAITGAYDAATGILTLTGGATIADYRTTLRSITFASTSDAPGNAPGRALPRRRRIRRGQHGQQIHHGHAGQRPTHGDHDCGPPRLRGG